MIFYDYDAQGFYVGWYEGAPRPNSTGVEPAGIQPRYARWNGTAWVSDTSREVAEAAAELQRKQKLQQAKQTLKNFTPGNLTQANTAIAALILLVAESLRDE